MVALAGLLVLAGCLAPTARPPATTPGTTFGGSIDHVFFILLENKGYDRTFSPSPAAPYLGRTLPSMGRLLTQYYGTGHLSLDNYISLVSGQAPNVETQGDCPVFTDFEVGAPAGDGQVVGQGCVYPASVKTVVDQLGAAGKTWKGYAEDMARADPPACRHPPVGSRDPWQDASKTDQYATRHVPFVYFHSVIDDDANCRAHVVDLDELPRDLDDSGRTPNYVFVTPDLCSDGHDEPCIDGRPGGYASIDLFLRAWVPRILASPAYRASGLLVVTFDESDSPDSDSTSCCAEPTGPNTVMPGIEGPGGGRTGTVLLSPCLTPATQDDAPYNHYSLLRTTEDVFGLGHLGYANQAGLRPIDLGGCRPARG